MVSVCTCAMTCGPFPQTHTRAHACQISSPFRRSSHTRHSYFTAKSFEGPTKVPVPATMRRNLLTAKDMRSKAPYANGNAAFKLCICAGHVRGIAHILVDTDRRHTCAGAMCRAPWLLGASRKGFLGALTGQCEPALRDHATVAACTAAIGAGADMIRVHNWQAGIDAARVGDAMFRGH